MDAADRGKIPLVWTLAPAASVRNDQSAGLARLAAFSGEHHRGGAAKQSNRGLKAQKSLVFQGLVLAGDLPRSHEKLWLSRLLGVPRVHCLARTGFEAAASIDRHVLETTGLLEPQPSQRRS